MNKNIIHHIPTKGNNSNTKKVQFQNDDFYHTIEELEAICDEEDFSELDLDSRPPTPESKQNISINLTSSLDARLAHIMINLSLTNSRQSVPVKALHDSGCSHSIISKETFLAIPGATQKIIKPSSNIQITGFNGSISPVLGTATIKLRFQGDNGINKTYTRTVIVHDNIAHSFMLGRDFTGSDNKLFETNNHLYLIDSYDATPLTPEDLFDISKHDYCSVPLLQTFYGHIPITAATPEHIPPFSTAYVKCDIDNKNSQIRNITNTTQNPIPFEIKSIHQPRLKTPDALHFFEKDRQPSILFYNDSPDDLFIDRNSLIGQITLSQEDEIYNVNLDLTDETFIQINNANFIEEDDILTENEKTEEFEKFLQTGSFTKPMTSYVESKPSITEFFYKDINKFETDKEFEQKFKLDHLSPEEKQYALNKFHQLREVFSKHDYDLGKARNFEMDIEVDTKAPRIQKYYPLPYKVRDEFRKALDQMIEYGIIRECNEPSLFCSNLLVTRRKNGQLRILLDGRLLNSATVRKPMCLVTTYETYAHLAQKKHVSVMDMSHSFFQIPLSKQAQPLTAFFSEAHGKRFCFTRAPQGLRNSPLYLKLLTDEILGDMANYVIAYADDIMIATDKTMTHHIDVVAEVLLRLKRKGIKMRPEKINLAAETIEFLGVIWNKGKLKIPEAKLLAFKNTPIPTNPKKVKSFVCAMSFYRRFIPRFAQLSKVLMDLALSKPEDFKWLPIHQSAFQAMIDAIINYSALVVPDPDKPFYVQTDASMYAAAGRVFQKDDENNELLLACVSRTFARAEISYGIFRKETLALLYTLKSLDFFLRFATELIILIDARAIMFLRICRESAGILLRFSMEIAKYDATIYHIPGKDNAISDFLSRNQIGADEAVHESKTRSIISEKDTEEFLKRLTLKEGYIFTPETVRTMLELDSLPSPHIPRRKPSQSKEGQRFFKNNPTTLGDKKLNLPPTSFKRPGAILPSPNPNKIRRIQPEYNQSENPQRRTRPRKNIFQTNVSQMTYDDLDILSKIATDGLTNLEAMKKAQENDPYYCNFYQNPKSNFVKHNGLLFYKNTTPGRSKTLLVLPTVFIQPLVNMKHYSIYSNHHSATRIINDIKDRYHLNIATLKEICKQTIASCFTCQNLQNTPPSQAFQRFNKVTAPRTTWAVDIVTNMPKSDQGNTAILVAIDMFTCYTQAIPIQSKSTKCIKQAIIDAIIRPFGPFNILRCDNEAGIQNSTEFTQFSNEYGFEVLPTSTAAPWSNGAAERAVQTIKKALKSFLMHEQRIQNWDQYVHDITYAHNNCLGKYRFSPEEIHFGYKNPSRTEILQFYPEELSQEQFMDSIVQIAEQKRQQMRQRSDEHNRDKMTQRNKDRQQKEFKEGDVVIQRQTQVAVGPHSAIQTKFVGPFVIKKVDERKSSAIVENLKTKRTSKSHFQWLTHYRFNPRANRLPENFETQFEDLTPPEDRQTQYSSPPPTQEDPNLQDGADDQNFLDDQDMFHTTKSQKSRRQRHLDQHTQSQQTQTTPPEDKDVKDSSEQTQQSTPIDSQLMDDDEIIFEPNTQWNISDDDDTQEQQQQQQPTIDTDSTQPTADDKQDEVDQSQIIQTQQSQDDPFQQLDDNLFDKQTDEPIQIDETQSDQQSTQQSQSQFQSSQPETPNKIQMRRKTKQKPAPEGTQDIINILDDRNQHTFTFEINDEIDKSQPSSPTLQPLQIPENQNPHLQDEFQPIDQDPINNGPRRLIVQYQPDDHNAMMQDRLIRRPQRNRLPIRQRLPRPPPNHPYRTRSRSDQTHRYPTRSKDKHH